ncbi:MAG: aggregation factor core [Cyanobacteria bacterium P01_C01_bin.118]
MSAEESRSITDEGTAVETEAAATDSVVEIEFVESAPKDRFVITNIGACVLEELTLELDLSQSVGMLIFDTSATGAGVEVFQPFEVEAGDIVQLAADGVDDGDAELALSIASLGPGDRASFTIDVDDTLPSSDLGQIRVADSEISGALATVTVGDSESVLTKFSGSTARANLPTCSSA